MRQPPRHNLQIWFMKIQSSPRSDDSFFSTGIAGLDNILGGGLTPGRVYLIEGEPGTGKTTTGLQFLVEGAAITALGGSFNLSRPLWRNPGLIQD